MISPIFTDNVSFQWVHAPFDPLKARMETSVFISR